MEIDKLNSLLQQSEGELQTKIQRLNDEAEALASRATAEVRFHPVLSLQFNQIDSNLTDGKEKCRNPAVASCYAGCHPRCDQRCPIERQAHPALGKKGNEYHLILVFSTLT
jgi:hypothetical protein